MQQLLTGRRRFTEFAGLPWEELYLRDCLTLELRPTARPTHPYTAMSIRSHCKGAYTRRVDDPSKVNDG